MRDEINSLAQIQHANLFSDPHVEAEIRSFHQFTTSVAGTPVEGRCSSGKATVDAIREAEFEESRFSHLTSTIQLKGATPAATYRWQSLGKGKPGTIELEELSVLLREAFCADEGGRRPYPSGGALYPVDVVILTGPGFIGIPPLSCFHLLPKSGRLEVLPVRLSLEEFRGLYDLEGVLFYALYLVNVKRAVFKYRARGYRLALMEIGSMYQNALQAAQRRGLSSRVLAGFPDTRVVAQCGLDPRLLLGGVLQAFAREDAGVM